MMRVAGLVVSLVSRWWDRPVVVWGKVRAGRGMVVVVVVGLVWCGWGGRAVE